MRKLIGWLGIGAIVAAGGLALAQAREHHPTPPIVTFTAHAQSVAFELFRGNRMIVPATLNNHQTEVLLDTGASVTTIDTSYARSIGLPHGQRIAGRGAGGTVDAELVSGLSLEVGDVRLDKLNAGVLDLSGISRAIGRPIHVVLGRDFFNSAVVSIDWAAGKLWVRSHDAFRPADGAREVPLSRNGPFNTISISIAGASPIKALLDLGSGGALALPRTYWAADGELTRLHYAEGQSGGVGGLHPARSVLVPEVTVAGKTFTNVPAVLSEVGNNYDPTQMANVGIGILKEFNVDLDLGRDRIYLRARADAPPFERDRSGTGLELIGNQLKVVFVSPQGPAAAAGLKEGDEIVAVDGRRVTPDYYDARDWTRGNPGTRVVLDRADGSHVEMTLRDYY